MSEREDEPLEVSAAADVPEGGGGTAPAPAAGDSTTLKQPKPADVPEGGGGTGG